MAVGTGYSKIITDGLVYAHDVSDVLNSYIGEPTTNLIPDAPNNGQFTLSNSWATYNTNQYCGNNGCGTYWAIPAIASVSNNIVTTVSAHQIRTYDVIQPNATGGGVNAGQNYFAKKISDTQFSLHEYNGSQDGSQGYINSATLLPKVWDSIGYDQRVSVNASSFPTGWWGYPHLPNSGLVKEVVSGGGRRPGTNCMRFNVWRGDGVADGMAYGVYTPVTAGDIITVSFYARAATPTAVGKGGYYSTYFGGYGSGGGSWVTGAYGEWVRNVFTWTASVTFSFYSYFFPDGSGDRYSMDIADLQVEVNKGHATPFTTGTRSNTQALLDISSKNNTLTLNNLSYDSNAQFFFDGTDDDIRTLVSNSKTNVTMEGIVYVNLGTIGTFLSNGDDPGGYCIGIGQYFGSTDNQIVALFGYVRWILTGVYYQYTGYHHIVMTLDSTSTPSIYINGNLIGTYPGSAPNNISAGTGFCLGSQWGIRYANTRIPVAKFYDSALTAAEIRDNYSHYKTRFNLP